MECVLVPRFDSSSRTLPFQQAANVLASPSPFLSRLSTAANTLNCSLTRDQSVHSATRPLGSVNVLSSQRRRALVSSATLAAQSASEVALPGAPPTDGSDIEATLLQHRRVLLSSAVFPTSADDLIRRLWYLDLQSPGEPILLVVNSPGGSVDAGMAIYDQIMMLRSPVTTMVTGLAASIASVIAQAAPANARLCSPNARFMIHQPSLNAVILDQASDLAIRAKEMLRVRQRLVDLYSRSTGQSDKVIEKALDRDSWLTAEEAVAFGLVDRIVTTFPSMSATSPPPSTSAPGSSNNVQEPLPTS